MTTLTSRIRPLLTAEIKSHIIAETRLLAAQFFNQNNSRQHCLDWAFLTNVVLAKMGIPSLLAAGNMGWRAVADEYDDGVSATHYSYHWDLSTPQSRANYDEFVRHEATGGWSGCALPEVHCWTIALSSREVVDFTVPTFPEQWVAATSRRWSAPIPTDPFIGIPDCGDKAYFMNKDAQVFITRVLRYLFRHDYRYAPFADAFITQQQQATEFLSSKL